MAYPKDFKARMDKIESDANSILSAVNSYKSKIDDLQKESTDATASISAALEEINKMKEVVEAQASDILNFVEENPDLAEDAQNLQANVEKIKELRNSIQVIYKQIYGYDEKNEAGELEHQEGLRDQLNRSYTELVKKIQTIEKDSESKYNSYLEEWNNSFIGLKEAIEELLPGATSAGLSTAYKEKQEAEESSLRWGYGWFVGIIVSMVLIGSSLLIPKFAPASGDYIAFISRLVLFAPLIWIGIYQNKKINISKKIIEEYAHKAAVMKTFDGLLKQIFKTDKNGNYISSDKVRETLLMQTLETVGRNPADCISDCNKSDNPMIDIFKMVLKNSKDGISPETIAAILNSVYNKGQTCDSKPVSETEDKEPEKAE